jgi:hypothetical protein
MKSSKPFLPTREIPGLRFTPMQKSSIVSNKVGGNDNSEDC